MSVAEKDTEKEMQIRMLSETKRFYLAFYLLLASGIICIELFFSLFTNITWSEFLMVFGWSYSILFFSFTLLFVVNDDRKEQKKQINPWSVYYKY